MSTQEYYPRKNSLLTGDLGSSSLYGKMQSSTDIGLEKRTEDTSILSSSNAAQNGIMAPPGLVKAPSDEFVFGSRRLSTPNHLLESIQKNTSASQEQPWVPEDRVLNQIWDERNEKSPDSTLKIPNLLPKFLEDGLDSPPPRTTRSFSFSVGNNSLGGLLGDAKRSDSGFLSQNSTSKELSPTQLSHGFSRSKSISYEVPPAQGEENDIFEGFSSMSLTHRASIAASDIWNPGPSEPIRSNFAPLYHRRASTQPGSAPGWADSDVMDPVVQDGNVMMSPEQIDRYREQRKFTHAPTLMTEYIQRFNMSR